MGNKESTMIAEPKQATFDVSGDGFSYHEIGEEIEKEMYSMKEHWLAILKTLHPHRGY